MNNTPKNHPIVSHDEWIAARSAFLMKEKEFTRQRDELNRLRRELPWEAVTKNYVFDGPRGKESLSDLFEGRSQLIVYHFMFNAGDKAGCSHCSFWADSFNPIIVHLNQRDVSMVAISRAPYDKLSAYEKRMGWDFRWLSSAENDFNFDYSVSFTEQEIQAKAAFYNFVIQNPGPPDREGISVFYKDESGQIFHSYSTYARGLDLMNTTYNYLDSVPKGRSEVNGDSGWVRRHDEYK